MNMFNYQTSMKSDFEKLFVSLLAIVDKAGAKGFCTIESLSIHFHPGIEKVETLRDSFRIYSSGVGLNWIVDVYKEDSEFGFYDWFGSDLEQDQLDSCDPIKLQSIISLALENLGNSESLKH